jgi:hypothetical protein
MKIQDPENSDFLQGSFKVYRWGARISLVTLIFFLLNRWWGVAGKEWWAVLVALSIYGTIMPFIQPHNWSFKTKISHGIFAYLMLHLDMFIYCWLISRMPLKFFVNFLPQLLFPFGWTVIFQLFVNFIKHNKKVNE